MSNAPWFPPLLALGLGTIFTLVSVLMLRHVWVSAHRTRTWPRTTGEVVSVAQERRVSGTGSDRRVHYVLVAHYRYRHPMTMAAVDATSDVPSRVTISQGSTVEVSYHPEDPSRSFIPASGSMLGASCLTLFTIPFLVVGLAALGVGVWLLSRLGQP